MKPGTPLGRIRGVGAGHHGTGDFWIQRLTSIASIPLTLFLIGSGLYLIGADYPTMRAYVSSVFVAPALILVMVVFIWHMQIGMKEIIVDYVPSPPAKYACLIANTMFTVLLGLTSVYAILKICFAA